MSHSTNDRFAKPAKDEIAASTRLLRAMEIFREQDTAFPMSYAVAFLMVGLRPGEPVSFYAKKMGLEQAVTSRLMLEIGQKSRHGGEGLDWVDSVPDRADLRVRMMFLTPKGKDLWRRIQDVLGVGPF
jgi:DNA-binding MarR family transcriptional regulator